MVRQKGKRKRAADKVKRWPLALLNPDWPRYILSINTMFNSEAKYRREREWKLTAVGNHKKLETSCSSARSSHMMSKSKDWLFLGTCSEWDSPNEQTSNI